MQILPNTQVSSKEEDLVAKGRWGQFFGRKRSLIFWKLSEVDFGDFTKAYPAQRNPVVFNSPVEGKVNEISFLYASCFFSHHPRWCGISGCLNHQLYGFSNGSIRP